MKQGVRLLTLVVCISVLSAVQLYADAQKDMSAVYRGCCKQGARGPRGPRGLRGEQGPAGEPGVSAYAEYVATSDEVNADMSAAQAFTFDDPALVDTLTTDVVPKVAHGGTTFTVSVGRYLLDYETSIEPTNDVETLGVPIAVYMGDEDAVNLTRVDESLAGSDARAVVGSTAWIHGRHIIEVTEVQGTQDVYIGMVAANMTVASNATDGVRIVRLTILKLS